MSTLIYVCGLLLSVSTLPDSTLSSYYQTYYDCPLRSANTLESKNVSSIYQIPEHFPTERKLWPVFTVDQVHSKNFKQIMDQGIKPGLLIPENFMNPLIYFQLKRQINRGAIPLLDFSSVEPSRFNSLATLATSAGLRPMGAYVHDGWNPLLKTLPKGLYIIQANEGQIPLPALSIQSGQHLFYTAYSNSYGFNGTGILLNPEGNLSNEDINYPVLGIGWKFLNVSFYSQPDRIHTSIAGHILLAAGLMILPLHLILSLHYPELLGFWGTSTSWLSVFMIIVLMIILVSTMLWRIFKKS